MLFFGAQLNEVHVGADLESMLSADQSDVVRKFKAPFDAVHGGVGFAAEVGISGYIHADIGAAWKLRKTEVQAASRHLHSEFVESGVAGDGVVLKGKTEVPRLVHPSPRAGILAEDLILRSGGKAGHERGRNAHAQERIVVIVPTLVEAGRPQAGLLHGRIVAANVRTIENGIGCRQRGHVDTGGRAGRTIVHWLPGGASYRNRKLRSGPWMEETARGTSGHCAKIDPI